MCGIADQVVLSGQMREAARRARVSRLAAGRGGAARAKDAQSRSPRFDTGSTHNQPSITKLLGHLPLPPHTFTKMNLNGGQDWNEVVLRKKPQNAAARKDEAAVNAVRFDTGRASIVLVATL